MHRRQVCSDKHDGLSRPHRGLGSLDRLHPGDGGRILHDVSTTDRPVPGESPEPNCPRKSAAPEG